MIELRYDSNGLPDIVWTVDDKVRAAIPLTVGDAHKLLRDLQELVTPAAVPLPRNPAPAVIRERLAGYRTGRHEL